MEDQHFHLKSEIFLRRYTTLFPKKKQTHELGAQVILMSQAFRWYLQHLFHVEEA